LIANFGLLALRQTEWEEQNASWQHVLQER
jgi:hypothetical protein